MSRFERLSSPPARGEPVDDTGQWHGLASRSPSPRLPVIVAWVLFGVVLLWVVGLAVTTDVRKQPLRADQASFLMQTLSLAHDHDLSYTAGDLQRWQDFNWADEPGGMFFQRHGDSWAFAKPYGYSLWLAPFVAGLGTARGIGVGNAVLFVILAMVCAAILFLRFRGVVVPLVLGAFLFGSVAMFGVFNVTTDLFQALLVACFCLASLVALGVGPPRSVQVRSIWAFVTMFFAAAIVAEKAPMVVLVGPLLAVVVVRASSWRRRALLVAAGAVIFALAVTPYLWYSGGRSLSPYGGERYAVSTAVPFGPHTGVGWRRESSDDTFSLHYMTANALRAPAAKAEAFGWYLVGRHTGLVMTMPLAIAVFAVVLARWRQLSGVAWAAALGAALYIAFYVVLFPRNYYGGGTSLGDRYFLQAAPIVLALAVAGAIPRARMAIGAFAGLAVGVAMLWPHYWRPRAVLNQLGILSSAQHILPNETNLEAPEEFKCPGIGCLPPQPARPRVGHSAGGGGP